MNTSPCRPRAREITWPYWALFAAMFLLYLSVSVRIGDDAWFATVFLGEFGGSDYLGYLSFRYQTWSTRVILEAMMMPMLRDHLLFKLAIAAWYAMTARATAELLELDTWRQRLTLCGAYLLIPLHYQTQAGYTCTTINYTFTLCCFLWAILPTVRRLHGQQVRVWQDVRSCALMIVACNMEFYVPPFLILSILLAVCALKQRKHLDIPSLLLVVIAIASGIFAATSPMNTVAGYSQSLEPLFPGFELLSLTQKLIIAINSTAGGLISTFSGNDDFFIGTLTTCALLALNAFSVEAREIPQRAEHRFRMTKANSRHPLVILRCVRPPKDLLPRVISCIPLVITAGIGFSARLAPADSAFRAMFFNASSGWAAPTPDGIGPSWMPPLLLAMVFFAALLFCAFRLEPWLGIFTSAALLSRITMGFANSVYASGLRTFTLLLFALATCSALSVIRSEGKRQKPALIVLSIGTGCTLLMNIIFLLKGTLL